MTERVPTAPAEGRLVLPSRLRLHRSPLVSARLVLRPVSVLRADELFAAVEESRDSLAPWLPWVPLNDTPQACRRYAQACERDWDSQGAARFFVHRKESEDIWGIVSLENCMRTNRSCNLGYWLHPRQRGLGLMTEAAARVVRFAFEEMFAHRITCAAGVGNHASRRVIERLGFRFEGIARDAEWVGGQWVSHAVYSRLADDLVNSVDEVG